jgi:hypothetical protein
LVKANVRELSIQKLTWLPG